MSKLAFEAFADELEKIGEEMDAAKTIQYGTIGALAGPAAGAAANLVEHGRLIPRGASYSRWLGARAASGAILGGAVPLVRHHLVDQ